MILGLEKFGIYLRFVLTKQTVLEFQDCYNIIVSQF